MMWEFLLLALNECIVFGLRALHMASFVKIKKIVFKSSVREAFKNVLADFFL